jgi:hypothetical protein
MSRHLQENIVALMIIAFFTAVLVTSLGYSPRARLVPVPIAALGIILASIQLIWQNFRSEDELNIDLLEFLTNQDQVPGSQDQDGSETKPIPEDDTGKRILMSIGFVSAFVGMILLIGPMPSILIFTAAYFILSKHYPWPKGLIFALAFTAVTYVLFVFGLELQLYHGILEPVVEWYHETF